MAKIERNTQQIFSSGSQESETAQFGSMITGTPTFTKDLSVIQSNPAFLQGFQDAVQADLAPYLEETNALFYMVTKQLAYILQEGIPEFDTATTYYTNSYCKLSGVIYKSLQDNNLNNNPASSVGFWEELSHSPYQKGQLIQTTIPLNDPNLLLANGQLLQGSNAQYSSFVSFVGNLTSAYPDLFVTETEYQQSITTNGVCGKYVYDIQANTLRIPTITGYIEGTTTASEIGNFTPAGLPNITGTFDGLQYPNSNQITGSFYNLVNSGNKSPYADPSGKKVSFSAALSSSIYKDNYNKVQTNSIKVFFYIAIK